MGLLDRFTRLCDSQYGDNCRHRRSQLNNDNLGSPQFPKENIIRLICLTSFLTCPLLAIYYCRLRVSRVASSPPSSFPFPLNSSRFGISNISPLSVSIMSIPKHGSSPRPNFHDPLALPVYCFAREYASYLDASLLTAICASDRPQPVRNHDKVFHDTDVERGSRAGCTAVLMIWLFYVASVPMLMPPSLASMKRFNIRRIFRNLNNAFMGAHSPNLIRCLSP